MPPQHRKHLAVRIFADPITAARDAVASVLIRMHVTPNVLTVLGTFFSLIAGYLLAIGADQRWSGPAIPGGFWAGWCLILACAMDMLDGAVANLADLHTPFGGILDSTMDRISDIAIFGGISLAYARAGNVTFHLLALVAISNVFLISYIKARAEKHLGDCSVGFWQRGERMVAILIACFTAHIGTIVVVMAVFPALTALNRLYTCYCRLPVLAGQDVAGPNRSRWRRLAFWQHGRGTWPHTIVCACFVLFLAFVDIEPVDFLRALFW